MVGFVKKVTENLSGLEGALLIARPYGDVARFQAAASRLLASLAVRSEGRVAALDGRGQDGARPTRSGARMR